MLPQAESKKTLFDFVLYLRKYLYEYASTSTPEFTQDEHCKINDLGGAITELMIFVQETGDRALYDILDDLDYAVKECGMGAPSAFKLDEYENKLKTKAVF
jgi:hypothetical protein